MCVDWDELKIRAEEAEARVAELEAERVAAAIAPMRVMSKKERVAVLDGLSGFMCLECGWLDSECCNCDTDDSIDYNR
jgi:hypothetical protein